ncbi:MAG: hypothetical protein AMXMBFR48_22860 [Ignavibacteriales bacterium]
MFHSYFYQPAIPPGLLQNFRRDDAIAMTDYYIRGVLRLRRLILFKDINDSKDTKDDNDNKFKSELIYNLP